MVTACLLALIAIAGWIAFPREAIAQPPAASIASGAVLSPFYHSEFHEVKEGDTAGSILREMGAPDGVLSAAGSTFNRVLPGHKLALDYRSDLERPWRVRLIGDPEATSEVMWNGKKYEGRRRPIPYTIAAGRTDMVVESSLWEAATDAGLLPGQIMRLAGIFEYDVDFNTELVAGASFRMVAESLTGDDGTHRIGDIRAAILQNGRDTFTAIRFRLKDGSTAWFAPDGTGRRKPFLRSPLEFSRVTSGFTTGRFHPILKITRAHQGVDLGAASGTPVRAVADGVVKTAGPHGGHGNFVELDHDGPYGTGYAHLSAILVKKGQTVHQGEVIGRVGSTGLSTGPHLHYEFTVNGAHVNPMSVKLPMTGTLPEAEKAAFFAVRDEVMPLFAN